MKLIKCCLNIRSNVPNDIVFIESGLLPLKAVILVRQFKFYKERFFGTVKKNSRRDKMLNMLLEDQNRTKYIQHYEDTACLTDPENRYFCLRVDPGLLIIAGLTWGF